MSLIKLFSKAHADSAKFSLQEGEILMSSSIGEVRNWLENMPLLDTQKSGAMLFRGLQQLNFINLNAKALYQRLEIFLEPIERLSESFTSEYINDVNFDLKKTQWRLIFARELYFMLATLFMKSGQGFNKSNDNPLKLQALCMAAYCYSKTIVQSYQLYLPTIEGTWSKLYQLYDICLQEAWVDKSVKLSPYLGEDPVDFSALFNRCLILAISNPYRISPKKLKALFRVSLSWGARLMLSETNTDNMVFAFSKQSDLQPSYKELVGQHTKAKCVYIETKSLASFLERLLQDSQQSQEALKAMSLSRSLIAKLCQHWCNAIDRRFVRHPIEGDLDFLVGIRAICQYAYTHATPQSSAASMEVAQPSDSEVPSGDSAFALDLKPWDSVQKKYAFCKTEEGSLVETLQARLINASENGYRLALKKNAVKPLIRAGKISAVRFKADEGAGKDWHLCIVRWVKYQDDGSVHVGLQVISKAIEPVKLFNDMQNDNGHQLPGILLRQSLIASEAPILVSMGKCYQVGDVVTMCDNAGNTSDIKLSQCIENSNYYRMFSVEVT